MKNKGVPAHRVKVCSGYVSRDGWVDINKDDIALGLYYIPQRQPQNK
jgi:hypothetical protein